VARRPDLSHLQRLGTEITVEGFPGSNGLLHLASIVCMTPTPTLRRRRTTILTAATALAAGALLSVLPASPASATGTADIVCGSGNAASHAVSLALVGNSTAACAQAQRATLSPSQPTRVKGRCGDVMRVYLPRVNAALVSSHITQQWQPTGAGPHHVYSFGY
jgi:hypothetical protein